MLIKTGQVVNDKEITKLGCNFCEEPMNDNPLRIEDSLSDFALHVTCYFNLILPEVKKLVEKAKKKA